MKKQLLFTLLTMTSLHLIGQNNWIGLKVGLNSTNTSSDFISSTNYAKTGLSAGLTYEHACKGHLFFGADLIYNQRGFKDDIIFYDIEGNTTGERYTLKFDYNYLSVPLKLGLTFGEKLCGFTNFGVIPSLLVKANTISPTFDSNAQRIGEETIDVTDRASKFDFAGLIEIGGAYRINERYVFAASFSYQRSLTTLTNADYFANSTIKMHGMALNLGVKYALTK
jgi:hypothetical protein